MSTVPLTAVPPRKARSRSPSPKITLEIQTNLVDSPEEALKAVEIVTSPIAVPDLLHEDSTLVGSSEADFAASFSKSEEDSPVLIDAEDAPSNHEPDTTIRLIGGGGVSGTMEDALAAEGVLVDEHEHEHEDEHMEAEAADVAAEVASIKSTDSKASKKTHGRKKSSVSSSLKKLGHLGGGKRKTDSVTSVDLKQ